MSTEACGIVSEKFMLNLDGVECGYVQSLTIGGLTTNVTSPPARPTHHAKKHPGPPKSEDIEIQIGLSMAQPVYDWIAATWTGNYLRKSGSVIGTDFDGVAVSERDFVDALITEVCVPALDVSVMEACFMNLKFSPKRATSKKGDGKVIGPFKELPKIWLSSNFQLTIDGLDCTRVNRIDSFTVNAINTLSTIGESRDPQSVPTQLVFPNLTITLAEISAQMLHNEKFALQENELPHMLLNTRRNNQGYQ